MFWSSGPSASSGCLNSHFIIGVPIFLIQECASPLFYIQQLFQHPMKNSSFFEKRLFVNKNSPSPLLSQNNELFMLKTWTLSNSSIVFLAHELSSKTQIKPPSVSRTAPTLYVCIFAAQGRERKKSLEAPPEYQSSQTLQKTQVTFQYVFYIITAKQNDIVPYFQTIYYLCVI